MLSFVLQRLHLNLNLFAAYRDASDTTDAGVFLNLSFGDCRGWGKYIMYIFLLLPNPDRLRLF